MSNQISVDDLLATNSVVPVIVIDDVADAVPLANAMVAGGIKVLEVTLRTGAAIEAIKEIATNVPDAVVGAGTVTRAEELDQCLDAGARFFVSPGSTESFLTNAEARDVTLLPGIATLSEALLARDHGFSMLKFFPAEASGGAPVLKAWGAPLPDLRFCPTGGVGPKNAQQYLSLKNVPCVGGSWMVPTATVKARDWAKITQLCQDAVALCGSPTTINC